MAEESAIERLDGNYWYRFFVGTIPYTGGAMGAISLKAQKRRDERLRDLLISVKGSINRVGEEAISRNFLDTEEFYSLLEFSWQQISQTADEKKLEYLRRYFLGSISNTAPDIATQELFKRYLLNMSGSQLRILELFHDKQGRYSTVDRAQFPSPVEGEIPLTVDNIAKTFGNYPVELTQTLCVDLCALGVLGDWAYTHPGEKVQTSFYLTDSGQKFVSYMLGVMNLQAGG